MYSITYAKLVAKDFKISNTTSENINLQVVRFTIIPILIMINFISF